MQMSVDVHHASVLELARMHRDVREQDLPDFTTDEVAPMHMIKNVDQIALATSSCLLDALISPSS